MKQPSILMWSLFLSLGLGACGGRTLQTDADSDAGAGGQDAGVGGSGGSIVGGSGGGPAGSGGAAGEGGGPGGSGGTAGEAGVVDSGPPPCELTTGEPACDTCMNVACYDQCNTCADNDVCAQFVSCALACTTGDSTCMQDCVEQYADGVQDGLPLVGPDGCLRENCASECIASVASCDLSIGDQACDDCIAAACMAECTECAENDACVELVGCAAACPPDDQGCLIECGSQSPGGIQDANAFVNGCVSEHCSVACQGAPAQCEIELGDAACDACVSDKCLASCNACAENDACVALVECATACAPDDQGCLTQCAFDHPTGITDANAFAGDNGCVREKCPDVCGGGGASCTIATGNAACDACLASECLGSCSACSENPDCEALVDCYFDCPPDDIQCQIQCGSEHPGGLQDAGGLIGPGGCVSSDCDYWCP